MSGRLFQTYHYIKRDIQQLDTQQQNIQHSDTQQQPDIQHSDTQQQPDIQLSDIQQTDAQQEDKSSLKWIVPTILSVPSKEPEENMTHKEYEKKLTTQTIHTSIFGGRTQIWLDAIEKIKRSPILGSEKGINGWTVHNTFLDVTVGTGVCGGLLYIIIVLAGCRDALLAIQKTPELGWLGLIYLLNVLISIFVGLPIERAYLWWFSLVALRANAYMYRKGHGTKT